MTVIDATFLDCPWSGSRQMARQGLTFDKGIAVMDSHERKLLSSRNFLVTVTLLHDELTLDLDNRDRVEVGLGCNAGDKTSAFEVTERVAAAAAKGTDLGNDKP